MHFNAFWHINTHHQILTSTEIRPIFSFPPHFSNLCMKIVPPYFAKEAGCVLVYMEWTPLSERGDGA